VKCADWRVLTSCHSESIIVRWQTNMVRQTGDPYGGRTEGSGNSL